MKLLSSWKTGQAAVALGSLSPSYIALVFPLVPSPCPSLDPSGLVHLRPQPRQLHQLHQPRCGLSLSLSLFISHAAGLSSSWKLFDVLFGRFLGEPSSSRRDVFVYLRPRRVQVDHNVYRRLSAASNGCALPASRFEQDDSGKRCVEAAWSLSD